MSEVYQQMKNCTALAFVCDRYEKKRRQLQLQLDLQDLHITPRSLRSAALHWSI